MDWYPQCLQLRLLIVPEPAGGVYDATARAQKCLVFHGLLDSFESLAVPGERGAAMDFPRKQPHFVFAFAIF